MLGDRVVRKRDGVSGKVKCEVDDRAKPEPKFDLTSRRVGQVGS
jgi:hypothetical protein